MNSRLNTSTARCLTRTGTQSKTIYFSQAKTNNRFDYQSPKKLQTQNPSIELRGTLNIRNKSTNKVNQEEVNPFRKMNLRNLPDSKRTLNPTLNYEPDNREEIIRSRSVLNLKKNPQAVNNGNIESILTRNQTNERITVQSKNINNKKPVSDIFNLQDSRKFAEPKKLLHYNEFHKYTDTTQIYSLPGGKKREGNDIRDDEDYKKFVKKAQIDYACKIKINKDYNSNVSCLNPSTPVSNK